MTSFGQTVIVIYTPLKHSFLLCVCLYFVLLCVKEQEEEEGSDWKGSFSVQ